MLEHACAGSVKVRVMAFLQVSVSVPISDVNWLLRTMAYQNRNVIRYSARSRLQVSMRTGCGTLHDRLTHPGLDSFRASGCRSCLYRDSRPPSPVECPASATVFPRPRDRGTGIPRIPDRSREFTVAFQL